MSLESAISALQGRVANDFCVAYAKGATCHPSVENTSTLADVINSIQAGGGDDFLPCRISCTTAYYCYTAPASVTTIRCYAFGYDCNLTSFSGPCVTSLACFAFYDASCLTSVDLPCVTYVGCNAFYRDMKLSCVNLPCATVISTAAFFGASCLKSICLPCVGCVWPCAFLSSCLTDYCMPHLLQICACSFNNTCITEVNFPELWSICYCAFVGTKCLRKIWLPSTVRYVCGTSQTQSAFRSTCSAVIFTDLLETDTKPSGWGTYWCHYNTGCTLTILYNQTYEDFLAY